MGKITVKHFLNTNLKPYIINGEKYYSIYLLITANRQNTKVKSYAYSEYYSEKDFEEITDPSNESDADALENEIQTITKLVDTQITELGNFDTSLFASVYNFFPSIYVLELELNFNPAFKKGDIEYKLNMYDEKRNNLHIKIDRFFIEEFSLSENNANGMSVYTYFSPKGQEELRKFLVNQNMNFELNEAISLLNQLVYFKAFKRLSWILRGSNKYEKLFEKYDRLFNLTEEFYCYPIYEVLATPIEYKEIKDPDTGEIIKVLK